MLLTVIMMTLFLMCFIIAKAMHELTVESKRKTTDQTNELLTGLKSMLAEVLLKELKVLGDKNGKDLLKAIENITKMLKDLNWSCLESYKK